MLSSQIKDIEFKIRALIDENNRLKQLSNDLESNLNQLEEENKVLHESLLLREDQMKALKTANAMLGSDEYKTKTKLKINALVREIDQCINQLAS